MFGKENILENCYKNPQIRLETRIAAIQAYRRVSCDTSVSIYPLGRFFVAITKLNVHKMYINTWLIVILFHLAERKSDATIQQLQ